MGVGMDRDEQVGALLVREVGAVAQRHEHVGRARQRHLDAEAVIDHARHAAGDVEHDLLLHDSVGPGGAGIVAAVAGIHHDQPKRLHRRLAALGLGGVLLAGRCRAPRETDPAGPRS